MEISKLRNRYDTDKDKEIGGVRVPVGDEFVVLVARAGNAQAKKLFRELSSTPEMDILRRAGAIPESEWDKIILEVQSRTILVGWTGLQENGVDVPYSPEKAKELLMMGDFRLFIMNISDTQENYRRTAVEGAAALLGKE